MPGRRLSRSQKEANASQQIDPVDRPMHRAGHEPVLEQAPREQPENHGIANAERERNDRSTLPLQSGEARGRAQGVRCDPDRGQGSYPLLCIAQK